jgi:outer membrane protein assembly factor BamB
MSLDAGSLITYHYPTQSIVSINVLTGNIDWRFGAPHDDPYIESNIITTGNLLFFSTQNKTYAVNMNGLSYVWSYNEGGNSISLSSNFILYISRDVASDSNFKLIAIKLK